MMFSKACEYGIKAVLHISKHSLNNERISLKEIASEIASPEAFTAKILQKLARDGVVDSTKGPNGGFQIQKNRIDEIKLIDIVRSIDGDDVFTRCGLGLDECNAARPCPVHDKFTKVRDGLHSMLSDTSLYDLATGLEVGITFLKR